MYTTKLVSAVMDTSREAAYKNRPLIEVAVRRGKRRARRPATTRQPSGKATRSRAGEPSMHRAADAALAPRVIIL